MVPTISVQDKVEALQDRLDAYTSGDKTAAESLDISDGTAKAKRCKKVKTYTCTGQPGDLCYQKS